MDISVGHDSPPGILMKNDEKIRSLIAVLFVTAMVVSIAYLAAGALHDRLLPEEEGPPAAVTMIAIATDGLGGLQEHLHVPANWSSDGMYDLGVHVVGLRSESGVVVKFSLSHPGISSEDVSVFFYDSIRSPWRPLSFQDEGDVLVATLGLTGGVAVYEGYDHLYRLLIISNFDGACQVNAWVETV